MFNDSYLHETKVKKNKNTSGFDEKLYCYKLENLVWRVFSAEHGKLIVTMMVIPHFYDIEIKQMTVLNF